MKFVVAHDGILMLETEGFNPQPFGKNTWLSNYILIQRDQKLSWNFRKFIMMQSGKVQHPNV
jgi:glutathione peroxidase-family protein